MNVNWAGSIVNPKNAQGADKDEYELYLYRTFGDEVCEFSFEIPREVFDRATKDGWMEDLTKAGFITIDDPEGYEYVIKGCEIKAISFRGDYFYTQFSSDAKRWMDAFQSILDEKLPEPSSEAPRQIPKNISFIATRGTATFKGRKVQVQFTTVDDVVFIYESALYVFTDNKGLKDLKKI